MTKCQYYASGIPSCYQQAVEAITFKNDYNQTMVHSYCAPHATRMTKVLTNIISKQPVSK